MSESGECQSCSINFKELRELLNSDFENIYTFCVRHNILARELYCPRHTDRLCKLSLKLKRFSCNYKILNDKRKKKYVRCYFTQSLFKNTFFAGAKFSLERCLMFAHLFCRDDYSIKLGKEYFDKISSTTFTEWGLQCREVCVNFCLNNSEKIGGPGKVVVVHESKIGKHHFKVGMRMIDCERVFGGMEVESRKFFFIPLESGDTQALLDCIKDYILPETTVMSKCLKAFKRLSLSDEKFEFLEVHHQLKFIKPNAEAEALIPNIEYRNTFLLGYLARAYFLKVNPDPDTRFHCFLKEIAKFYSTGCDRRSDDAPTDEESSNAITTEVQDFIETLKDRSVKTDLPLKQIYREERNKFGIRGNMEIVTKLPKFHSVHEAMYCSRHPDHQKPPKVKKRKAKDYSSDDYVCIFLLF